MQITSARMRHRLLSAAGALALSAATLLGAGGTAGAAQTAETGSTSIQSATLGWTCVGPSYNRKLAFTIASTGIPAGSTWTFSVSRNSYQGLQVFSDSGYVPSASGTTQSVNLSAPSGVPAGVTVTLEPVYYLLPTSGYNTLTLSGHGGSVSVAVSASNRLC